MIVMSDLHQHRSRGRWECGNHMLQETRLTEAEDEMSLQTEGWSQDQIHICSLERGVRNQINLEYYSLGQLEDHNVMIVLSEKGKERNFTSLCCRKACTTAK